MVTKKEGMMKISIIVDWLVQRLLHILTLPGVIRPFSFPMC